MNNGLTDAAFGRLIAGERTGLIKFARSRFGISTSDAEDLVQQTLLKAWLNREFFTLQEHGVMPWLITILRHEGSMVFRKRKLEASYNATLNNNPVVMPGAEAVIEFKHVTKAVGRLTRVHQDAVVHSAFGYSLKERVKLENGDIGALKTRTRRGRQLLRCELGEIVDVT